MTLKRVLKVSCKVLSRVLTGILFAAICFLIVYNVYTFVAKSIWDDKLPTVLGYGNVVVISGSMEPEIKVGDMLIVKRQDTREYQVGDIITYRQENSLVTHRIISIDESIEAEVGVRLVTTQGDANNAADNPISSEQIEGKVVRVIPRAGDVILAMKSPFGMLLLILAGFLMIELPYLFSKIRRSKNEEQEGEN